MNSDLYYSRTGQWTTEVEEAKRFPNFREAHEYTKRHRPHALMSCSAPVEYEAQETRTMREKWQEVSNGLRVALDEIERLNTLVSEQHDELVKAEVLPEYTACPLTDLDLQERLQKLV